MKKSYFVHVLICWFVALLFALPVIVKGGPSDKGLRVGFSTVDLASCIKSDQGYRMPLEVNCMAIDDKSEKVLLYALDFGELYYEFCLDVQVQVGKRLNINPESIMIHTTHTHSAPADHNQGESIIDRPQLVELLIRAAEEAMAAAKPAKVKIAEQNVGKSLSVYRRGDTGTGLGVQTYWFGYEYSEGDDRPEASALVNEMSSRWKGQYYNYKIGAKKIYFDGEVDPLVQTMYFVDMRNKPLGSIVRFSAHPHLASFFKDGLLDPDFPGRTRDLMEKELGGHCLFLLGGSGNLVPKEKVKYKLWDEYEFESVYLGPISEFYAVDEEELMSEMTRIGEEIAHAAINSLKKEEFTNLTRVKYTYKPLNIPINPALPATADDIEIIRRALEAEYSAYLNAGGTLEELRRLANAINWLDWGAYYALGFVNDNDRKNGYKSMPYSVLEIGSTPVVFMNSEGSVETTLELREMFKELNPWIISLTGGTISYLPTDKMIDEGGYEGRNTVITRGTETLIKEHVSGMLK